MTIEQTDTIKWLESLGETFDTGQSQQVECATLTKLLCAKLWCETNKGVFDRTNFIFWYDQFRENALCRFGRDLGALSEILLSDPTKYSQTLDAIGERRLSDDPNTLHLTLNVWWTKSARKRDGQFPTPPLILRFMLEIYPPQTSNSIGDFGGATGLPLVTAANHLPLLEGTQFYFGEIHTELAAIASCVLMCYRHARTGEELSGITMHVGDSMETLSDGNVDHVLANPVYSKKIKDEKILKQYETGKQKKSQKSQFLHAELCLRRLKPGGTCAIIMDYGSVTNLQFQRERQILAKLASLELVVELPIVTMEYFAGTSFRNVILFFRKSSPTITRFERIKDVGYDETGYIIDGTHAGSFDFAHEIAAYEGSCLKAVTDRWKNFRFATEPDQVYSFSYKLIEDGNWLWASLRNLYVPGPRLGDICELLYEQWDGVNQLNPSVDRQYRLIKETHLNPKEKERVLRSGCLLMNRIVAANQQPVCALVTEEFDGAGATEENYIIRPNNSDDLARIWYFINCDPKCRDYIKSHCRGTGRGRINYDDLLKMPVWDLSESEIETATKYIGYSTGLSRVLQKTKVAFGKLELPSIGSEQFT